MVTTPLAAAASVQQLSSAGGLRVAMGFVGILSNSACGILVPVASFASVLMFHRLPLAVRQ